MQVTVSNRDEEITVARDAKSRARNNSGAPGSADDYAVYPTASPIAGGEYVGKL
jgi:hypothetical protein